MMKVRELKKLLDKMDNEATIELFHQVYCGGGEEETLDDPRFLVNDYGVFIAPATSREWASEWLGAVEVG